MAVSVLAAALGVLTAAFGVLAAAFGVLAAAFAAALAALAIIIVAGVAARRIGCGRRAAGGFHVAQPFIIAWNFAMALPESFDPPTNFS